MGNGKAIRRNVVAAVVSLVPIVGFNGAAQASDLEGPQTCTKAEVNEGLCVVAAVTGDEDPVVAGVIQSLKSGVNPAAVDRFIQLRGNKKADKSQDEISKISQAFKAAKTAKEKDAVLTPMNAGGVGTVYGSTLYMNDTVTYLYCGSGSCSMIGKVAVEYRMGITGNLSFTLAGDLNVTYGPSVQFKDLNCYTYYDGPFNIDSVVKTWNNCNNAEKYNFSTFTQIWSENWSGGTLGEVYHPTYTLRFVNAGGAEIYFGWDAREYKIESSGWTHWT